jgi:hypothetical protein
MRLVLVAAVLALLAGCTSGAKHGTPAVRDLHDLAGKLGCTFTEEPAQHEMLTNDEGSCGDLTLYSFAGSWQRDTWVNGAVTFGGNYVVGATWVVSADSPAAVRSAQAKVGGQIRP